jgi:hypothetical protein
MTPSKIISRKLIDSSSMQSAGVVVIFICSRYSGVSYISTVVCDKSPSSSREAWTLDNSVSVSGDVPTIRISIDYSDFASAAGASAPSAPSSFFSVSTSTSFGISSGTYSWNSEAITTVSVSSLLMRSCFFASRPRSEI